MRIEKVRRLDQRGCRQAYRHRKDTVLDLSIFGNENDQRTLKELGAFGMWMRDTLLMPLFAPLIGRALTKVYAGEPALAA